MMSLAHRESMKAARMRKRAAFRRANRPVLASRIQIADDHQTLDHVVQIRVNRATLALYSPREAAEIVHKDMWRAFAHEKRL